MASKSGDSAEPIIIVDHTAEHRSHLAEMLREHGWQTLAFNDGQTFLASGVDQRAGCAIIERFLPDVDGLALQRELRTRRSPLGIVMVATSKPTVPDTVIAMREGAASVLLKPTNSNDLANAVREALHASHVRARREEVRRRMESLTAQEREVLQLLADGAKNVTIAQRLGVSTRTVESRRHDIHRKTNTRTVAELIKLIAESGPTDP